MSLAGAFRQRKPAFVARLLRRVAQPAAAIQFRAAPATFARGHFRFTATAAWA